MNFFQKLQIIARSKLLKVVYIYKPFTPMKDYDSIIVWLDYYNKGLSRGKGRKISKLSSIYDPMISELIDAANSLGYDVNQDQINDNARFPRRPHIKSGYIMLPKQNMNKSKIIRDIANKIIINRSKQKK